MGDPVGALAAILPAGAVGAELVEGEEEDFTGGLSAEELTAVEGAGRGRRREFAGGRECARRALRMLGMDAVSLPVGADGAPVWPQGVVGSITHKGSYRAAAVAYARDLAGLGIDAELDAPLPAGLLLRLASPHEQDEVRWLLAERPGMHWDRVLFSAKEAALKATASSPIDGSARIGQVSVRFEKGVSRFSARISTGAETDASLTGAWERRSGFVLVAASTAAVRDVL